MYLKSNMNLMQKSKMLMLMWMDRNIVIKHAVVPPELSTIPSFKLCPKQVLQARLINLKTTIVKE